MRKIAALVLVAALAVLGVTAFGAPEPLNPPPPPDPEPWSGGGYGGGWGPPLSCPSRTYACFRSGCVNSGEMTCTYYYDEEYGVCLLIGCGACLCS